MKLEILPQEEKEETMTVLLVDDSPMVLARLTIMLSDIEGVKIVGQAQSGREAVEAIRKLHPDVAVLDIQMPNGSGFDVLEQMRKEYPALVFVILSNYAQEQYRKRGEELGADFFFDKSTEFEKLIELLTKFAKK